VRRGKRSPRAALRIAIDLAEDPTFPVGRSEALDRVAEILREPPTRSNPDAEPVAEHHLLAVGLPASPGRVTGRLCRHCCVEPDRR
jgi:pyruvate,orthophosphate dikinase